MEGDKEEVESSHQTWSSGPACCSGSTSAPGPSTPWKRLSSSYSQVSSSFADLLSR